ncbi:MAG TPA: lipopolysaccharide heptosyltransferase II [Desulfobacterales bacterium]|nr:lipopolysaccharide heptosyltransferase II [Desulfobacterales bacterium]
MKKTLVKQPVSVGNHHSPLPLAVRSALSRLTVKTRRPYHRHQIRNILVRAVNWVGDAILTLPALNNIKNFFPAARVTVWALPRVAPVFYQQPVVDELIPYLPKPPGANLTVWLKSLFRLRRQRFDLSIIFPNSVESALTAWATGTPQRAGYDTDGRGFLLTQAVQGPNLMDGFHQVYRHHGILRAFNQINYDGFPKLILSPDEMEAGLQQLTVYGWRPRQKIVALSPGAAYGPAKQWRPERFAAVADRLQQELGAFIVLLGSTGDQAAAAKVAEAMDLPPVNLVGRTDLRTAFALISQSDLLISNDSGLMHAAAALWTPLVALFGSTDPVATGPFTPLASVVHHYLPCSPCRQRQCPEGGQCWDLITVDEVLEQARFWLTRY